MNDKFVYDLCLEDLNKSPIWYFPMDETVEDETVVRPVDDKKIISNDIQIIVKTIFEDKRNTKHYGYIYYTEIQKIEFLQPVILSPKGCITFWNGMYKPDEKYIKVVNDILGRNAFPLTFCCIIEEEQKQINGIIEGLYYIDNNTVSSIILK